MSRSAPSDSPSATASSRRPLPHPALVLLVLSALALLLPATVVTAGSTGATTGEPPAEPAPETRITRDATFQQVGSDARLEARLELSFPGRKLSRTLVHWVVSLADRFAQRNEHGFYNVRLSGRVLSRERPVDRFDYRFDLPAGDGEQGAGGEGAGTEGGTAGPPPLALVFERDLRPGTYAVELLVEDLQDGRRFHTRQPLEVPQLAAAELETAQRGPEAAGPSVRILTPETPILIGYHRIAADVRGDGVERVTFLLDGEPVFYKGRPPYEVELDLGEEARVQTLAVEAHDADGELLARDEILVNTGQEPFSVHLLRPRPAGPGLLTIRAELDVPAGRQVERLDVFVGETKVATLRRRFQRRVEIPRPAGTAAVRAVAHLGDGRTAEDTVLANARLTDRVEVHLVELYTAAVNRWGRPVEGLAAEDFRVLEDGEPQQLRDCRKVDDLPLRASLVVDVSGSMESEMEALNRVAVAFLDRTLKTGDRVSVVTFDRLPRVAVPFTGDLPTLANGLTGLRARGGTALLDGLLFALQELQGMDGQRTLILFSDGGERQSGVGLREVVEYARRGGVTLYTVGLRIPWRKEEAVRLLHRLADETGGRAFFADDVEDVEKAYRRIEREIRSRYLLTYQSAHGTEARFRTVDVEVLRPGTKARTVRGYHP